MALVQKIGSKRKEEDCCLQALGRCTGAFAAYSDYLSRCFFREDMLTFYWAFSTAKYDLPDEDDEDKRLLIGFSTKGNPLER